MKDRAISLNDQGLMENAEQLRAITNAELLKENEELKRDLAHLLLRKASVTPKTGHWIDRWWEEGCEGDSIRWRCSECKELSCCNSNFCGDCGAKMEVNT